PGALLTCQADYYRGRSGAPFPTNQFDLSQEAPNHESLQGGNFLTRFTRTFSDRSSLTLQAYYDRVDRESHFGMHIDTVDLDAQHRFALGDWNDVIWGLGYRWIEDHGLGGEL